MPDDLIPWFDKKLRGNAFALNPLAYLLKPSSPILSWDYMTWERIGKMIDGIEWNGFQADLVIGVLSGGGFIEPLRVKEPSRLEKGRYQKPSMVATDGKGEYRKCWSRILEQELVEILKAEGATLTVEPPKGKTYRNILVVDDSVSSERQ